MPVEARISQTRSLCSTIMTYKGFHMYYKHLKKCNCNAFCLDVISWSLSLVSHLTSLTFSCYPYTISHSYYQNFLYHLYITPSNFAACTLIAKNVFQNYTVTLLQGGHMGMFATGPLPKLRQSLKWFPKLYIE